MKLSPGCEYLAVCHEKKSDYDKENLQIYNLKKMQKIG